MPSNGWNIVNSLGALHYWFNDSKCVCVCVCGCKRACTATCAILDALRCMGLLRKYCPHITVMIDWAQNTILLTQEMSNGNQFFKNLKIQRRFSVVYTWWRRCSLHWIYCIEELNSNERVLDENEVLSVNNSQHGSGETKTCRHAHADCQRYNNCGCDKQAGTLTYTDRLAYCETETDRAFTLVTDTQPHWNRHRRTHTHCSVMHTG